ncbi:MAG: pre-peptidase C-terminal domain-containing protein [Saprospiraceae bacterium]
MNAIRQLFAILLLLISFSISATAQNSCNNPILLNCSSNYTGSNNTGTYNYTSYPFANYPNGMTGPEAYHRLTIVYPALITITMTHQTQNQDLDLYLLSACNNYNGLAYSQNYLTPEQISINLNPGTYYIIVDGWNGAISNYSLNVNCTQITSCSAPVYEDIYTSNLACSSVRLNCQTAGPNAWIWAYRQLNTVNWTELPAVSSYFNDLNGLQASTTYEFKCKIRCSNYVWSEWSPVRQFSTPNCGPTGKTCGNPIPAYCGYTYTGNNGSGGYNFNTYKKPNGQTVTNETGPEMYYRITLSTAGPIIISLGGLSGDLDLFLLSNCNNNAVVAWSGNPYAQGEVISLGNLPAGTYQIVIDGWNYTTSNYTLSINNCNSIIPISNDEPCYPTILTPYTYCYPTNATNVGATTTTNPPPPAECSPLNMRDVWFKVGIPASGKILVSTFPGTLTDGLIGIYAGAYCTGLTNYGCYDDYPTTNDRMPDVIIHGTPGSYVYLRVWGYNGSTGTFSICVTTLNNLNDGNPDVIIEGNSDDAGDRDGEANSAMNKWEENTPETAVPSLRIFPVPAQDEINVSATLAAEGDVSMRILSLAGQVVKEENLINSPAGELETTLDISSLPSGTYLLRFRANGQETTSKFVKM